MNVKPGDLARVVAPYHAEGRGAFVVVRGPAIGRDPYPGFSNDTGRWAWLCDGYVRASRRIEGPAVVIYDHCLRAVPGLDATEEASNALPNVMAPRRQMEFSR
jgi:hypothetical protein